MAPAKAPRPPSSAAIVAITQPRPVTSRAIAAYDTARPPSASTDSEPDRYSWEEWAAAMGSSLNAVAVLVATWSVPLGSSASAPTYSTAVTGRKTASTRWRTRAALPAAFFIWMRRPRRSAGGFAAEVCAVVAMSVSSTSNGAGPVS